MDSRIKSRWTYRFHIVGNIYITKGIRSFELLGPIHFVSNEVGPTKWYRYRSLLNSCFVCAGGTFALYSLLCRHAKVNTIPNQHRTDEELTTYSRNTIRKQSFAAKTQRWLEAHAFKKNALLLLVLVGTCMVIGDGILTPAISGNFGSLTSFHILFNIS